MRISTDDTKSPQGIPASTSGHPPSSSSSPGPRETPEPTAPPLPPPSYDDAVTDIHRDLQGGDSGVGGSSTGGIGRNAGVGPFGDAKPSNASPQPTTHRENEEGLPLLSSVPAPTLAQQSHGGHPIRSAANELTSRDFFASLEYQRTAKGYSSTDMWLNTDARALHRFISECNERPHVSVKVVGSHTEDRVVDSTTRTENGQTQRETHTHRDTVVDFRFCLELTPYIHERGTVYTARAPSGEPYDLDTLLADYVRAENALKELKVQKKVIWDYEQVRTEIMLLVKSTGYPHTVNVSFPMENDAIQVRSSHALGKMWRHPVTSFLCFISCACLVGWPVHYAATKRWRNKVMSDFVVLASPKDYVDRHADFIRNQVVWSPRPFASVLPSGTC
ncbi:hypothetical protein IW140_002624 [Coemansia sp. RSA 1813]|nr:hypothetical protein EV178_002048 [Coemansia sp. RSA 1646]KAJ1772676.1 hypothetical protein LPJ74_001202 [Coemansia sp. RSA 1843]KAJ2090627.1 hypothetical protein IW138_002441 [Coemansia sp. RSA 986]KAJ2216168.1 hypothetical protein EV179_001628 [Coemansia sp. RSA 487]KAJ2570154.1 hypothetical protein IW140_002624 [Coemansia sp. RSA 1813]